jgi:hypothetical protein
VAAVSRSCTLLPTVSSTGLETWIVSVDEGVCAVLSGAEALRPDLPARVLVLVLIALGQMTESCDPWCLYRAPIADCSSRKHICRLL